MTSFKNVELGKIVDIEKGKAFLHDALELTSCEISVNSVP